MICFDNAVLARLIRAALAVPYAKRKALLKATKTRGESSYFSRAYASDRSSAPSFSLLIQHLRANIYGQKRKD
jgi:hypothetical protein